MSGLRLHVALRVSRIRCRSGLRDGRVMSRARRRRMSSPTPGGIVPDGSSSPNDAGNADAPDVIDATPSKTTCSVDGWCVTPLPDANLRLVDVWPFGDRVLRLPRSRFARREGPRMENGGAWSYIDDTSQNDFPGVETNIWAPTPDEVYFALSDSGTYGAWIYRGGGPRRRAVHGRGRDGSSIATVQTVLRKFGERAKTAIMSSSRAEPSIT